MEERGGGGGGKPPLHRARSGTLGAASPSAGVLPRKVGGYHSEGYFSSDQDEDAPRRTGNLSLGHFLVELSFLLIFERKLDVQFFIMIDISFW